MWSGPRNVSTAMMYSWRQRADTEVVDEPWYANYLVRTGVDHPGAAAVIDTMAADPVEVIAGLLAPSARPVRFLKNMAHHLEGLDLSVLDLSDNFLMVRDPRQVVPSLTAALGRVPTLDQTGFELQAVVFDHLVGSGSPPPVVVTAALLEDPRRVLGALCEALGLDFDEAMLSWPPGPKPEDGLWAPHWYAGVHATSGFGRPATRSVPMAGELGELVERCLPIFDRLSGHAL
jgi:hypothetical protein